MLDDSFLEAARDYWEAAGRDLPLPSLPPDVPSALLALIDAAGCLDGPAFASFPVPGGHYEAMAVGEEGQPHRLFWALTLAEVAPFVNDALPDVLFLVDRIADPKGEHRVYELVDLERGPLEFPSVPTALAWMAARLRHGRGLLGAPELLATEKAMVKRGRDKWEKAPLGGRVVLEGLLDTPLPEAWDAYARGKWPMVEATPPSPPTRGAGPSLGRWVSLSAVTDFLRERRLVLPEGVDLEELGAPHRALLAHLRGFDEAIRERRLPSLIAEVAAGDDPALAALAEGWRERYEAFWGEGAPPPAPEVPAAPPLTPFARRLMGALDQVLDALVAEEQLELDAGARPALLAELTEAGSDARSAKHMIRKITNALVHSDHVEEIYVTDDALADLLRSHLGG